MIRPPHLKPGDVVAITSTARKVNRDYIDFAAALFESWGLKVRLSDFLFEVDHQFAGTDKKRRTGLQRLLNDDTVRAIFCARGGYGTIRILDDLDFSGFNTSPKWIVGYSDVTALHCHLQQHLQTESLHASMPVNFKSNTTVCLENMRKALFGESLHYASAHHALNRFGEAEGIIIGGNLSMLYSLNGSRTFPDTSGKILFLEDLDEYLYHIDRMMMNMKRCGALKELAGLVVGGMNNMHDNEVPFGKTAEEIIRDAVSEYDYPVTFGFPAGHIDDNNPLIFGRTAQLVTNANGSTLSFGL